MPFIFYSSATTGEFCFESASTFTLNCNNKTAYTAVLIPQVIGYIHAVSSITWYVLPTVINTITLTAHQQMSITSMGASGLPSPRKTELVTFEKPNKQKNSAQMRARMTPMRTTSGSALKREMNCGAKINTIMPIHSITATQLKIPKHIPCFIRCNLPAPKFCEIKVLAFEFGKELPFIVDLLFFGDF